jgi:hypothetical protein
LATLTSLAKPSLQLSPRIEEKAPPSWVETRTANRCCVFFGAVVMRQCHAQLIRTRMILQRMPPKPRLPPFIGENKA